MIFDIDVSGEDLFNANYVICIANKDSIIKGFKFDSNIINIISSRHGQDFYRYEKSRKGKVNLKIRIYCVILFYLFDSIKEQIFDKELNLNVCKDFDGKENEFKLFFS